MSAILPVPATASKEIQTGCRHQAQHGRRPPDPAAAADELHRLTALYGSGLLDEGPQAALDALVELAATLLDCPVAMLNLIDRDVQHGRAITGGPPSTLPREIALCNHTIRSRDGIVIPDLAADVRFAGNPLVEQGIRFYAGAPVSAPDAAGTPRRIGALCVTDAAPRTLDQRGQQVLRQLATLADVLIAARRDVRSAVGIAVEHKRLVADLARQHRVFAQAERMTGIGSWRLSLADERLDWSEGLYGIYGLPPGSPPSLSRGLDAYPEEARGRVSAAIAWAIEHGEAFDFEEDFRPFSGGLRRVRCLGEVERVDGHAVALTGVLQDVTERHRMEAALRRDADTDALTGLANRAAFDRELGAAMERARHSGNPLLVALVDLDGFKAVNDTLGHAAGDDALRQIGAVLAALPIEATAAARIGGDEFALIVEGPAADRAALGEILGRVLMVSTSDGGLTMACSGSVGMAMFDDDRTIRDFVRRADQALYVNKRARVGERRRAA